MSQNDIFRQFLTFGSLKSAISWDVTIKTSKLCNFPAKNVYNVTNGRQFNYVELLNVDLESLEIPLNRVALKMLDFLEFEIQLRFVQILASELCRIFCTN